MMKEEGVKMKQCRKCGSTRIRKWWRIVWCKNCLLFDIQPTLKQRATLARLKDTPFNFVEARYRAISRAIAGRRWRVEATKRRRKCKKCGIALFAHSPYNGSIIWACVNKNCSQYLIDIAMEVNTHEMPELQ